MRFIVVGGGRMGSGLARALCLRGHEVTVIDCDQATLDRLKPGLYGTTVRGVAFDRDVLLEAGITRADGLAAVTASDDANIVTARLAKQVFHVPRAVARVYDPAKAAVFGRLGLQTISTTSWGISRLTELLVASPLDTVASLGNGGVDLVEAEAPPLLVGRMVEDITVPGEVRVVAISRGASTFLPDRGAVFQERDILHLAVAAGSLGRAKTLLALP